MTDNEIIKALECCIDQANCKECPLHVPGDGDCVDIVNFRAYEIIKHQKAEIEKLKEAIIKADAYFSEGLFSEGFKVMINIIKEMVGERE